MFVDENIVKFQGRSIELQAPASQVLEIPGTATKVQEWASTNKESLTLEVRARIVETSAPDNVIPVMRFAVEIGHGVTVWEEPVPFQVGTDIPRAGFTMPGRGMVFTVNARTFRIMFTGDGGLDVDNNRAPVPVERSKVEVSIQPTVTSSWGVYPPSLYAPVDQIIAFPMVAREWRLMSADGTDAPAAPNRAPLYAVSGALVDGTGPPQGQIDEFRPIPHEAAGFAMSNNGAFVAFR